MAPIVETEYARNRNVETATRIRDYLLALPLQSLPVSNPETGQKIITDSEELIIIKDVTSRKFIQALRAEIFTSENHTDYGGLIFGYSPNFPVSLSRRISTLKSDGVMVWTFAESANQWPPEVGFFPLLDRRQGAFVLRERAFTILSQNRDRSLSLNDIAELWKAKYPDYHPGNPHIKSILKPLQIRNLSILEPYQ